MFVDEAGHLTEPDTLVAVGLLQPKRESQIVLAGDPMQVWSSKFVRFRQSRNFFQLGPVVQSKFAKLYGLGESMLERLCNRRLYSRDQKARKIKFYNYGHQYVHLPIYFLGV